MRTQTTFSFTIKNIGDEEVNEIIKGVINYLDDGFDREVEIETETDSLD
jgi:hypothetical protein